LYRFGPPPRIKPRCVLPHRVVHPSHEQRSRARNMNDLRLAVVGAAGRMGRMLLQTIPDTLGMRLSGALESANSPTIGQDSGTLIGSDPNGVLVSAEPESVLE